MENKSTYIWVIIVVLVIIGFFVWRSNSNNGASQNTWVCNNGQWTAVGNPQEPTPTSTCTNVQQSTSTQSVASSTVSLVLQPKQCTTEPWQTWYKEGHIQFIKAPTDEQLIKAYYSSVYKIDIISAQKTNTGNMVCQTCNICAKGYVFTIEANAGDVSKLTSLGWMNVGEKQ